MVVTVCQGACLGQQDSWTPAWVVAGMTALSLGEEAPPPPPLPQGPSMRANHCHERRGVADRCPAGPMHACFVTVATFGGCVPLGAAGDMHLVCLWVQRVTFTWCGLRAWGSLEPR